MREHPVAPPAPLSRETPGRGRRFGMPARWVVMVVVAALVVVSTGLFVVTSGYLWGDRADARAAARALKDGDLAALDTRLAAHRGQPDFAYFFASRLTPRDIGDALGSVAGPSAEEPFKPGVDVGAYEITLTDLAGTLALATHGQGSRALPESWTRDFITATTTPQALYGEQGGLFNAEGRRRDRQDVADKANLLLVLSRGYWSSEFLQAVTAGYYEFDRREGDHAWPKADPADDVGYAPAPTAAYVTDGILALTAALTANPAASEWAFTQFQPGSVSLDGSGDSIGTFTHYLLFEHRFPDAPDGGTPGMTATLTALSSAIDSSTWASGTEDAVSVQASSDAVGPLHDAAVLRELAQRQAAGSGCSWNPADYWNCTKAVAEVIWQWIQHWGHVVLDILTLATFAPPPFTAIGLGAAATNATWQAIEGDYAEAGLSLAAAVPGLAYAKIAAVKAVKAGAAAERTAADAAGLAKVAQKIAKVAQKFKDAAPPEVQRVKLRKSTKEDIFARAAKDAQDRPIDPNTGRPIVGTPDIGHKPGYEWKCTKARAIRENWSRERLIEFENDPTHYQLEAPSSNRSHAYEATECAL